jgi:hypothetical protein
MSLFARFYSIFYPIPNTRKAFFMVYDRLTGRAVFEGATHDTAAEAIATGREIAAEFNEKDPDPANLIEPDDDSLTFIIPGDNSEPPTRYTFTFNDPDPDKL